MDLIPGKNLLSIPHTTLARRRQKAQMREGECVCVCVSTDVCVFLAHHTVCVLGEPLECEQ